MRSCSLLLALTRESTFLTDNQDRTSDLTPTPRPGPRRGRGDLQKLQPDGRRRSAQSAPLALPVSDWIETFPDPDMLLALRRRRRLSFLARIGLFVLLPTLATFCYLTFFATPRSTVEFQVSYQTYRAPNSLASSLAESAAGTSSNNNIDLGTILYQYIRSPALLDKLDRELDLRAYFSKSSIDFVSRMSPHASYDTFLRYYRWRVSASEGLGGYVQVDVEAFDPQFAQKLAEAIVKACEAMMDQMTSRARSDEVQLAQDEVVRQEARVRAARQALTEFQNAHGDLDPNRGAAQLGQIVGALETDIANARAQLANAVATLSESSPIVVGVKSQIASLEDQLRAERARLAGTASRTPYSEILDQYSALQLDEEFAKTAYTAAQQGLSVARADAARTQNYLIVYAPPNLADAGGLTSTFAHTATVFLGTLLVYAIISLLAGAFHNRVGP